MACNNVKNKQGETRGQPRTVVGPTHRNQLLQCFEFHDKHGRNRRKERICFDHELVRDQNKCDDPHPVSVSGVS